MLPTFETDRLLLRPTDDSDADFILTLVNTPKWLANIGDRKVRTLEDAYVYIQTRITPQFERLGYGNYTVIRQADGAKLGSAGLYDRPGVDGIDLGFALLPEYEGRGYALESACRVRDAAFGTFGLETIYAVTIPANAASQKLLEKLGMSCQQMILLPGAQEEIMLYAMQRPGNS